MATQPTILPVDRADPRVRAAEEAERRLFEHYGLEYRVHFVDLVDPAIRVRVLDVGSGPPVVLVPGGSGEAIQYVPLIDKLSGRRFIILNLPGGGMSDGVDFRSLDLSTLAVTTISAVLDYFEVDSVPIAGSSMGGLWALWMAIAKPEHISSMIQFGCPALVLGTSAPLPMRLLSIPMLNRLLFPLARAESPDKVRNMLGALGCTDDSVAALPEVFFEALANMFSLSTYRFAWLSLMRTVLRPRGARAQFQLGAAELSRVGCPTLFIWGADDPFSATAVGRRCVELMPNATIEVVPGGHVPIIDNVWACGSLTDRFLPALEPLPDHEPVVAQAAGGR